MEFSSNHFTSHSLLKTTPKILHPFFLIRPIFFLPPVNYRWNSKDSQSYRKQCVISKPTLLFLNPLRRRPPHPQFVRGRQSSLTLSTQRRCKVSRLYRLSSVTPLSFNPRNSWSLHSSIYLPPTPKIQFITPQR